MPPHTIEYREPKDKGEVPEDRGSQEEEEDVVDDKLFPKADPGMMIGFRVPWTDIRYRLMPLGYCIALPAIA